MNAMRWVAVLAVFVLSLGCASGRLIITSEPEYPPPPPAHRLPPARREVGIPDRHHPGPAGYVVDIPRGHLPPPGQCRIWYPGEPPGNQPPPGDYYRLRRQVPPGAWLLYRPPGSNEVVRIR